MVLRPRLRPTPLSDRLRALLLPLPRRFAGDKAVAESGSGGGAAASSDGAAEASAAAEARKEAYRQIQNLDFMTAAKILFTTPPKRKKFGLDFHLVQLFFACMPSLAVYLVAQYARYEIRRMEAEVEEKKKKAEEEEKAKQAELESPEEEKDLQLSKVIDRLDKLEEVVKEIVDEKKKTPPSDSSKDQEVKSKEAASSAEKSSDQKNNVEAEESTANKSRESPKGQVTNVEKAKAASS